MAASSPCEPVNCAHVLIYRGPKLHKAQGEFAVGCIEFDNLQVVLL